MKSVLLICPFEKIYPPVNGGMQRFFHIIHQLARFFNVTVIIHQDKDSFMKSAIKFPAMENVMVYTTGKYHQRDIFSLLPKKYELAFRYRWLKKKLLATADGNYLKYYPIMKHLLKKNKFDVILLENLSTLNAVSLLRKLNPQAKIIYNAHNVDSHLANISYERWGGTKERYQQVLRTEQNFHKTIDAVLACSEKDKKDLSDLNNGKLLIEVVPNGVNIAAQAFENNKSNGEIKDIMFCGALWTTPNSEGLNWFAHQVWPHVISEFPNLKLLVVGSGQLLEQYSDLKKIPLFDFIGEVSDVASWYHKTSLVVVPLLSGSGTRLKVLEAMGMGKSIVSTAKGAEGIDCDDGKNIIIRNDPVEFAKAIIALLHNAYKRRLIGQYARKLAEEKYDWNVIGNSLANFIKNKVVAN